MIEREDFDLWRDHPVTVHVFKELKKVADKARDKWIDESWECGIVDPVQRAALKATADIVNDLITVSYEDIIDDSADSEAGTDGGSKE